MSRAENGRHVLLGWEPTRETFCAMGEARAERQRLLFGYLVQVMLWQVVLMVEDLVSCFFSFRQEQRGLEGREETSLNTHEGLLDILRQDNLWEGSVRRNSSHGVAQQHSSPLDDVL